MADLRRVLQEKLSREGWGARHDVKKEVVVMVEDEQGKGEVQLELASLVKRSLQRQCHPPLVNESGQGESETMMCEDSDERQIGDV